MVKSKTDFDGRRLNIKDWKGSLSLKDNTLNLRTWFKDLRGNLENQRTNIKIKDMASMFKD